MTHNPFKAALTNAFVNGRGELSANLQTSRSKVAERIRSEQRRARLRELFWTISELKAKLRKLGTKPTIVRKLQQAQAEQAKLRAIS